MIETVVAQLEQLTDMPIIVFFAIVGIVLIILLIFALGKTKPATAEARIGQYNIILLPDGKSLSGLVTLAKKEVSPSLLYDLVRGTVISKEHAEDLADVFKDLYFYAMRSGRRKYLICSSQNLESPKYALVTTES